MVHFFLDLHTDLGFVEFPANCLALSMNELGVRVVTSEELVLEDHFRFTAGDFVETIHVELNRGRRTCLTKEENLERRKNLGRR